MFGTSRFYHHPVTTQCSIARRARTSATPPSRAPGIETVDRPERPILTPWGRGYPLFTPARVLWSMAVPFMWIAGIGVLAIFLLVPTAVIMMKKALAEPEPVEQPVERQMRTESRESPPRQGQAGS